MTEIGYALSSEEFAPDDLVTFARAAEDAGFTFALISDHFHPWIDAQGQSPFVWSVLGAIAQATERLTIGTGVTCPTIRIHPAIIAQAAATTATMMPGRFFLGVGTGENLNEHITGARWPSLEIRQEMLEDAVEVMRTLWDGGLRSYRGRYFTVENARIYTLPEEPVPIMVAAAGEDSAELAGRIGDGLISTAPKHETIETFEKSGGSGPKYGQLTVCYDRDEERARKTALEQWPNAAIPGQLGQELSLPSHFEQAAKSVTEDSIAETILCGPDPSKHLEQIRAFTDAGFDHVYVHQIGPAQTEFIEFYAREIIPNVTA
jgi:coenzyme F420-dependent glucose-6-phosphate dehydrogenase